MNFPERLKEIREKNNASQKAISDKTGISLRYYQYIEYGTKEPTLSKLLSLANYFNVSIDYLVGRTDNPDINK